jgi:DNA-binding NarL/FixJ family response regulator
MIRESVLFVKDGNRADRRLPATGTPALKASTDASNSGAGPVMAVEPLPPAPLRTSLSPRQQSVLRLISLGLSNKSIARELGITPDTVKSHARQVLAKFRAKNRAEAVACAARCQII